MVTQKLKNLALQAVNRLGFFHHSQVTAMTHKACEDTRKLTVSSLKANVQEYFVNSRNKHEHRTGVLVMELLNKYCR